MSKQFLDIYLAKIKVLVENNNCTILPRNILYLREKGLQPDDVWEIILDLNCSHLIKGPESDHDPSKPGSIFVFRYEDLEPLYIKIRFVEDVQVVCISFHRFDD